MSLPPQLIHIKRKRAEEPVESLFIQSPSEHSEAKRRATHQDFVFRRLIQDDPSTSTAAHNGIPQIRPTQPGREHEALTAPPPRQQSAGSAPATPEPRRFHLTRTRASVGPRASSRKRVSLANKDAEVAVFVEQRHGDSAEKGDAAAAPTRQNGAKPTAAASPGHSVDPEMHERMLAYAAEIEDRETEASQARSTPLPHGDDDAMDTSEDYVYDTYVRHDNVKASSTMDTMAGALSAGSGQGGVGYLVITEEDQPFWETFADDEGSSEGDWDSEQDDENAENYYGADYPEDEVESDDEFGHGAYRYRHRGASDEEEYDLEADAWSDEEALQHPWEKKAWSQAERRAGSVGVDGVASDDE